jgi:hypothetical protein
MLSFVADTQVWIRCHDWSHGVFFERDEAWMGKGKAFCQGAKWLEF